MVHIAVPALIAPLAGGEILSALVLMRVGSGAMLCMVFVSMEKKIIIGKAILLILSWHNR